MESKAFGQLLSENLERLRDELEVKPEKWEAFVRATRLAVQFHIDLNPRRLQNPAQIRRSLRDVQLACEELRAQCDLWVWPQGERDELAFQVFHRLRLGRQIAEAVLEEDKEKAALLGQLIRLNVPDRASLPDQAELKLSALEVSYGPDGAMIRQWFLGFLEAIRQAAVIGQKGRQGTSRADVYSLAEGLAHRYQKYSGHRPTRSEHGPFAKYLRACLATVGTEQKYVKQILRAVLPKTGTLRQQRQQREQSAYQLLPPIPRLGMGKKKIS